MENLFLRVLTLSLTASLVLLPLLALAPRLHYRYAGRTFYVLWLVLAVRLVLPLQPVLPEPAVTVELPPSQAVTVPAVVRPRAEAAVSDVPQSAGAAEPAPAAPEAGRTFSWTQLGTWLWLGGVAALLVYQGAGPGRGARLRGGDRPPGGPGRRAGGAAGAAPAPHGGRGLPHGAGAGPAGASAAGGAVAGGGAGGGAPPSAHPPETA